MPQPYTKWFSAWQNKPSTSTPLNAAALDHIEEGIQDTNESLALLLPRDILLNGSVGIWQRGVGPYTADLAYTADAWQIVKGGGAPTLQVDQETTEVSSVASARSMKITYTHGSSESRIRNRMIDFVQARGKVATFRMWVKGSTASAIRLGVTDGVGTTHSSYHTGSGAWERLVVSRTIDNASTEFSVFISLNAGSAAVFYADNADTILGSVAASSSVPDYWSADPLEELVRAQRRYQLLSVSLRYQASGSTDITTFPLPFPTTMGGTPTVSVFTTGTRTNIGTIDYFVGDRSAGSVRITPTGAGNTVVSNDVIALEWNP